MATKPQYVRDTSTSDTSLGAYVSPLTDFMILFSLALLVAIAGVAILHP